MHATPAQRALGRDLAADLDAAPLSSRPLRYVVSRLPALLSADQACAFLVRTQDGERRLDFFHGAQMPAGIKPAYQRWLATAPRQFALYDPDRPEERQRNVALRSVDLTALTRKAAPAIARSFLPRFALSESDQLRALVCDGPSLLSWVGAFRARGFSRAERGLLGSLIPALQRRLSLERRMADAQERASEVSAALEEVPAAAFVLAGSGAVLHANAAGRALLARERAGVEDRLRAALSGGAPGVQLARLSATEGLRLAVLQQPGDPAPRVEVARARWSLTPRQAQVLRLVGQGMSNRAAAASLGCAESTVELHVSALLEKSQSESRAQLVARLWSAL